MGGGGIGESCFLFLFFSFRLVFRIVVGRQKVSDILFLYSVLTFEKCFFSFW